MYTISIIPYRQRNQPVQQLGLICILWLGIFTGLMLGNGCTQQTRKQNIHSREIQNLAWFIEDICHGLQRDSKELIQASSSSTMLHLIAWLLSSEDQDLEWPRHIRKRIAT
ncbi:MAG: hypothetical protein HRU15_01415, partial [Planctomycetes bacterium]|nr:hypothetical protein [Planctomycetota bacterium]